MSYQLIGNISALICDDGIEPLAHATLKVYLPPIHAAQLPPCHGVFREPQALTETQVAAKADRLLASVELDLEGNFRLSWQEIHLFTEPLEIDICIEQVAGSRKGLSVSLHFNLGVFVPHWRRSKERYIAAFAYIIPSECWTSIRHRLQSWAITGVLRHYRNHSPIGRVLVQAFNARNGKKLGEAFANEQGRFRIRFAFEPPHRHLLLVRNGEIRTGPDVFFKVLTIEGFLLWSEDRNEGLRDDRLGVPACSKQDIFIKPSPILKSMIPLSGWRQLVQIARLRRKPGGVMVS